MVRHAQIAQNNKFAISLQHLRKEMSDVDFLLADKHKSLLQIDSMIFDGMVKHSKNSQNLQVCTVFTKFQKRSEVRSLFMFMNMFIYVYLSL